MQLSTQKALSEKNVTIGLCDSSGRTCQLSPIEKTYCRHADYNFRVVSKKTSPLYDKTRFCVHYLLVSVFECCCLKIAFNFGLCFLLQNYVCPVSIRHFFFQLKTLLDRQFAGSPEGMDLSRKVMDQVKLARFQSELCEMTGDGLR